MGVYVYTRQVGSPAKTPQGPVYRYTFRNRLSAYDEWTAYGRKMKAQLETFEDNQRSLCHEHRAQGGCLVTIASGVTDKPVEGQVVYRQTHDQPVWYDVDDADLGEAVGFLSKTPARKARPGRGWNVLTVEEWADRHVLPLYSVGVSLGLSLQPEYVTMPLDIDGFLKLHEKVSEAWYATDCMTRDQNAQEVVNASETIRNIVNRKRKVEADWKAVVEG